MSSNQKVAEEQARYQQLVQQYQQVQTPEEQRAALSKKMLDEPEVVLGNLKHITQTEMLGKMKPALISHAKGYLRDKDGFEEFYKLASVKKILDKEIGKAIDAKGEITEEELDELAEYVTSVIKDAREVQSTSEKEGIAAAKRKVGAISHTNESGEIVYSDIDELAKYWKEKAKTKKGREEFKKWQGTEEYKQVWQELRKRTGNLG